MVRRQRYERWYYYRRFKDTMDALYKCGAWACLLLGLFAGVWFQSFWLGVFFYIAALAYHAQFIARQQRALAQFWGEGYGAGFGRALRSVLAQYAIFGCVLLIFFCGAFSRYRSAPPDTRGPSSAAPRLRTFSDLSAALSEAGIEFDKRTGRTIYSSREAYVRTFELRNNRPMIRTCARNREVGDVLTSCIEAALRKRGCDDPLVETDYEK